MQNIYFLPTNVADHYQTNHTLKTG